MAGPLEGVRVIEVMALGSAPFAAMMLGDMGADVIRVHRATSVARGRDPGDLPVLDRNRRSIGIDLKHPAGVETLLRLVESSDVLLEGYRPGVAERLGFGPQDCWKRNQRLVFGRVTGWGQDGPLADVPGHDLNYIALAGALAHFGRAGAKPTPPANVLGDFAGGGLMLAFGVLCALWEAQRSGQGQVVDAAMVDGTAVLMSMIWGLRSMGAWDEANRGANVVDSGAPNYDTYECADGRYISLAAIEPHFYADFLRRTGLDGEDLGDPGQRDNWPALRERFTALFLTKARDEWCDLLEGSDACFAPVLTMSETVAHPHHAARSMIVEFEGIQQPAPAPRFSRTGASIRRASPRPGQHTREVLAELGWSDQEIDELLAAEAIK